MGRGRVGRITKTLIRGIPPLLAFVLTAGAAAQDAVFRTNVSLVRLLATVKDRDGAPALELSKSNFKVYDNGVEQQITVFERHTSQPLSVAILLDTSGSTGKDLKYETDSVIRFGKTLFGEGNPDDRATLYTFNWEVVQRTSYTRSAQQIDRNLRGLKGEGGTSLYDALWFAARDIEERDGRHVLIVVTDGGDTTSSRTFQQALEAVQLADAVIYSILVMPITNDAGRNIGGENALATFAEWTGGRVFAPSVGPQLDEVFAKILRDLRTQYLVGFYPKNVPRTKDRYHRVRLTVDQPGLRVQTRNGYYGEFEH
jgi:Ca-activated chloride channel family protein